MSKLIHFLLVYDHNTDQLITEQGYAKAAEALDAYSAAERAYDQVNTVEIVLIASDSLETIRQTHANYFKCAPRSHYFDGVIS